VPPLKPIVLMIVRIKLSPVTSRRVRPVISIFITWGAAAPALREHRAGLRRRTDAQRKRAERAERAGVAVAARDDHARRDVALLGNDHVANAVVADIVEADLLPLGPRAQRLRLDRGCRIFGGATWSISETIRFGS